MARITTAKINPDACKIGLPEIASVFLELNYTTHCRPKHQFQTLLVFWGWIEGLTSPYCRQNMSETYSLLLNAGLSNRHQRPLLRLSDDHLLNAALQVLVRTWRSCTVTDQSLLSVRVRLMMEEKKLLPCSGPINMGAWFLWTISIWRQKEEKGGQASDVCAFTVTFLLRGSGDPEIQTHVSQRYLTESKQI